MLVDQQPLGLGQHAFDLGADDVVGQGVAEFADPPDEAVIGGRGVTGVDREQFSLDVGSEIVNPGGVRDGRLVAAEGWPLHRPFEVGLDGDVQPRPAACPGTIRSTAVFAKIALAANAAHSVVPHTARTNSAGRPWR